MFCCFPINPTPSLHDFINAIGQRRVALSWTISCHKTQRCRLIVGVESTLTQMEADDGRAEHSDGH